MSVKKHYATVLKEENAKLLADIKKIVNGDVYLSLMYRTQFKSQEQLESIVFCGDYKPYKEGDIVKFNGVLHRVVKGK